MSPALASIDRTKNPSNLDGVEVMNRSALPTVDRCIVRACLLKEALASVLDRRQVDVAAIKLDDWIS